MTLTIAYMTTRRTCHIDWFFDSLAKQISGPVRIVVVDLFQEEPVREDVIRHLFKSAFGSADVTLIHVPPKPNVWNGKHRLTKQDWFAAASARNTALCLAPDGFIVFADDLSVLMPGWFERVKAAMDVPYIVLGAYKKVRELKVENGVATSFIETAGGLDSRWYSGSDTAVIPAAGSWMYGCSCGMPTDWILAVGGFAEFVDGMSFEDVLTGIALEHHHFPMRYDRRMLTLESEEGHFVEPPMRREDPGMSPNDKSHRALNMVKYGNWKYFDNYFEGGIPALRKLILAGQPFPPCNIPQHDWWDGRRLEDL